MHPQLQAIVDEFESAGRRLHTLADRTLPADWARRTDPSRWSIAECVAHLNLTSAAYVPLIRASLTGQSRTSRSRSQRLRRDPIGWLLWKTMGPPVRFRTKTIAAFAPVGTGDRQQMVAELDRWITEQIACVRESDGLPLDRIRITSPFNVRLKYSLYSCLTILPRHLHRHLWQAEQVRAAMS